MATTANDFAVPAGLTYIDPEDVVVLNECRLEGQIALAEDNANDYAAAKDAFAWECRDIINLRNARRICR